MASEVMTFTRGELDSTVNQRFRDVAPGFAESSESPVMWTPLIVPAAVVATQASCFSAFC